MQKSRSQKKCNLEAQDLPNTLMTFWDNQLERLKLRAEEQVNALSAAAKAGGVSHPPESEL